MQKEITQQKILRAAMELFATRGFEKTSISRIAEHAGISRASIFWHFSDKATLFDETCRFFMVPFREALEETAEGDDPRARVFAQIAAYEAFIAEHRATIHSFVSWLFAAGPQAQTLRTELLALHRAFISRLEADIGQLVDDAPTANRIAATIVSTLHGNMLLGIAGAEPDAPLARAELILELIDRLLPDEP